MERKFSWDVNSHDHKQRSRGLVIGITPKISYVLCANRITKTKNCSFQNFRTRSNVEYYLMLKFHAKELLKSKRNEKTTDEDEDVSTLHNVIIKSRNKLNNR